MDRTLRRVAVLIAILLLMYASGGVTSGLGGMENRLLVRLGQSVSNVVAHRGIQQ